jgi:hypothetical protein
MRAYALASLLALPLIAAAPLRDAPEHAADDRGKIVCKKFIRTGSLVDGYRVCKTKANWQRDRDDARALGTGAACGIKDNPDPLKPGSGSCAL